MIYELRQYKIKPGRMADCHRMFREAIIPAFERAGIRSIGYWEPVEPGEFDLHYLVAFESVEARATAWPAFIADPEWQAEKASWADGPPYATTLATVITPTDYSPAR